MRKVAIAASAGFVKAEEFEKFWPGIKGQVEEKPSWAESSLEFRKEILAKRKLAEQKTK